MLQTLRADMRTNLSELQVSEGFLQADATLATNLRYRSVVLFVFCFLFLFTIFTNAIISNTMFTNTVISIDTFFSN